MTNLKPDSEQKPCSVDELLLEFNSRQKSNNSSRIKFSGMEAGKDVYNITAPFEDGGALYIAGRVEDRDSEMSKVVFFCRTKDVWEAETDIAPFALQDPFIAKVDGLFIFGGVEVFDDEENPGKLNYRTVFYKGSSIRTLERFAKGPVRMKDIRICSLEDHRILVMTRPQGEIGGRGKIGYLILDSLEELNEETIAKAKVIENQFLPEEWGGCNELHPLTDGNIGILSHIAKFDEKGNRHYYSTAFCFNYRTESYSPMKIIAVRDDFEDGPAKREDLRDVIFSGGLIRNKGRAELYCGVSDAEGHVIEINDPFLPFEK